MRDTITKKPAVNHDSRLLIMVIAAWHMYSWSRESTIGFMQAWEKSSMKTMDVLVV